MRIVAALGGNALLRRGEPAAADRQRRNVAAAASALAKVAERHELVITHGNGPQVGLLALEAEAYPDVPPYPLDVLDAETQGMIGYLLVQALAGRQVAALLTQVVVDTDDPAFGRPTKPIGPVYEEAQARRLASERGWSIARDGRWFRRVVPSPEPRRIVELDAIEQLLAAGAVVVCAGGGGIPVVERDGKLEGVEAVIDRDLTAALLASAIGADLLVLLTDVAFVMSGHGTRLAEPLRVATPDELRALRLPSGSMGPKAEAACRFVEAGGERAAIGSLSALVDVIEGTTGTSVVPARRPQLVP